MHTNDFFFFGGDFLDSNSRRMTGNMGEMQQKVPTKRFDLTTKKCQKNPERDAEPQGREKNHQEMQRGHNIAVKTIL